MFYKGVQHKRNNPAKINTARINLVTIAET